MNKYLDDTMLALICLLSICLACIFMQIDGVKDIALSLGGGIVGFLSKSALNNKATPPEVEKVTPLAEK